MSDSSSTDRWRRFLLDYGPNLASAVWAVVGGLLMGSVLGFFLGVPLFFVAALIAIEFFAKSPRLELARKWLGSLPGVPATAAPVLVAGTRPPQREVIAEQLCKLWLYERCLPEFEQQVRRAKTAKERLDAAFRLAMTEEPSPEAERARANESFELVEALNIANLAYRDCFNADSQLSFAGGYTPSRIPIEGLDRLPESLQPEFRRFHDQLEALARAEPSMRNAFHQAIDATSRAIESAARTAIDRANQQ